MSKRIRVPLTIVLGLAVLAGIWTGIGYAINRGSGHVISEQRDVAGFDRIALAGSGKLIITQGDKEGLTVEAEDNLIGKLVTVVEDGVLRIGQDTHWWTGGLWPQKDIIFHVSVKNLSEIRVSGSAGVSNVGTIAAAELAIRTSGSAHVDLAVKVQRLVSTVSGSGRMTFRGSANQLELHSSGSARFFANNLTGSSADVRISGSGRAEVNVSKTLNARISGSGVVSYLGDPDVRFKASGSGRVTRSQGG